jgi:MFS family permease
MVSYTILWLCDGMVVPSWSEVLANTVDENRHGRLLGFQILFGGFAGIGAGAIVNVFLSNPQLNSMMAFGWLFLIGGILLIVSCVMMSFAKNAPHTYKVGRVDVLGYFKELPKHLVHEKDYAHMMAVQFLFLIATMCIPFTILFAGEKLAMPQKSIAVLILVQSIGIPLGGWMWGQICDRLGAHNGVKLAGVNILLAAALPLLTLVLPGSLHLAVMCLVLFLSGVSGGIWSCYFVYTIQAVRPESRSACMVLSSIITLPASFASFLAGFISDSFGFTSLFLICIAITLGGIVLAVRLRPVHAAAEERKQKMECSGVHEASQFSQ